MVVYSHTLMTSQYAISTTYASIRQTRRSKGSMCHKCCSDSRNSATIANPRRVNLEFQTLPSWGLLRSPMESAWNRTRSPQSMPRQHWNQVMMSRCFSESRTSMIDLSENMQWWPFHSQNDKKNQKHLGARNRNAQLNGNGFGEPNCNSEN